MDGPRRHLFDEQGRRRATDDVLAEYGNVVLRKALLDDAMHRLAARPDLVSPPRVFVSYKWESDEHRAWAAALADALIDMGWEVVADRDFDPTVHRTVEEFVARLVSCGVFLAIATPAYVVHAMYPPMHDPSWVFDECQSAMLGELTMHRIALTPDGTLHTPDPQREIFRASRTAHETAEWRPFDGGLGIWIEEAMVPTFDEIFVMPARDDIAAWVAEHMTFTGEPVTGARADELGRAVDRIEAETADDPSAMADALEPLVRAHPQVSGLWTRYIRSLRDAGRTDEASDACADAVASVDRRDGWRALQRTWLEVLQEQGDRAGAFQRALDLLQRYPGD
ncbi:MAG TPA: TIR domain-containing protein, partial [Ilumatobacteraceae bacterium]